MTEEINYQKVTTKVGQMHKNILLKNLKNIIKKLHQSYDKGYEDGANQKITSLVFAGFGGQTICSRMA